MPSFDEVFQKASELGFDDAGITSATIPQEDIDAYEKWIASGSHAKLGYMENTMRTEPNRLFPGAKTAIIFVSYYKQEAAPFCEDRGVVASYARGRDYHNVHRKRLKKFIRWLEEKSGMEGIAKPFSDSKPIMEKALAVQAGLGWFGKNTLLIHRRFGTFTLLSGVLTTLSLPHTPRPKLQHAMRCGSCDRCLQACPTNALHAPYKLDAYRCLSYQLIESKEPVPDEISAQNPGYAFGCDLCQDACPHNVRKPLSSCIDFSPESGHGAYYDSTKELQGTPLKRSSNLI